MRERRLDGGDVHGDTPPLLPYRMPNAKGLSNWKIVRPAGSVTLPLSWNRVVEAVPGVLSTEIFFGSIGIMDLEEKARRGPDDPDLALALEVVGRVFDLDEILVLQDGVGVGVLDRLPGQGVDVRDEGVGRPTTRAGRRFRSPGMEGKGLVSQVRSEFLQRLIS